MIAPAIIPKMVLLPLDALLIHHFLASVQFAFAGSDFVMIQKFDGGG